MFESDLLKTILDSAQVSAVFEYDSLKTLEALGQFASGFDNFLDDLLPDGLVVVSHNCQFWLTGIHIV